MSKLDEIKLQLELWDNRFPLDPPSDKHAEILYDTIRQKANIFKDNAIEHIRILLSLIVIAEKALEKVINEADDHKVEPWERMKEMEKHAIEALQQLRS
jgi:hypothetical protein